jgi:transposase-like protein
MNAPTLADCNKAIDDFVETREPKYPKAATSLVDAHEHLVTLFDFPSEHWLHLRTTNPIESTFATVKLRQRATKGAGSRAAGLAMAFKLLLAAERTWHRLHGHEKLPLVRAGVRFQDGIRVERDDAPASSPRPIATTRSFTAGTS